MLSSLVSGVDVHTRAGFTSSRLQQIADEFGEAFYVFDEDCLRANFERMTEAFCAEYAHFRIAYSYKTNYTPYLVRLIDELGGYAEVVSEMEYELATAVGVAGPHIVYNGPYKSPVSLRQALHAGAMINLDSMRDCRIVLAAAAELPERQFEVALRCNFELPGSERSRFGLDVEGEEFRGVVQALVGAKNVRIAGLHSHFPNRDLDTYRERARQMVSLAQSFFAVPPRFLNFGGGYCGAMPESLARTCKYHPPSYSDYAGVIGGAMREAYGNGPDTPLLLIEPGTALVADAFRFYAQVISLRCVGKRKIATVAGSIFNISPNARSSNLPLRVVRAEESAEEDSLFDIAGYTCIEGDLLSREVPGSIHVGDFVEYSNMGSYSLVMKPPFIAPNFPVLCTSEQRAALKLIKRKETTRDIFRSFLDVEF